MVQTETEGERGNKRHVHRQRRRSHLRPARGTTAKATLDAGLAAPKQFEVNTPQHYESTPGTSIGAYNILRILEVDGSSVVKKSKV